MTDHAAIAFTPAPASDSPNLRSKNDSRGLETFQRLLRLAYSSLRRWNPDLSLALVTTKDPAPAFGRALSELSVEVVLTDFHHAPPKGFYPAFNASLFSIDAINKMTARHPAADRVLLLDPDVICTAPLTTVFGDISQDKVLAYDLAMPADEVSQGLTALDAAELHRKLDSSLGGVPRHYGGELYGLQCAAWTDLAEKVEEAWQLSLEQWRLDEPRMVTEEHLLNFALRYADIVPAGRHIRRIWTAPTYRAVQSTDSDLTLWHLPAEKHRGLAQLHDVAVDRQSWFWTAPPSQWREAAAKMCGVASRRSPRRWTWDMTGSNIRYVQRALSAART